MAIFQRYLPLLQQVEGGFQNNPNDPGNYNSKGELVGTNFGISGRFYESVIGRVPSEQDIRNITKDEAALIYRDKFWNINRASELSSQAMANTIVDHQVNSGRGVKLAQQVLNQKYGYNLTTDGVIGNQTLTALNRVNAAKFVYDYNQARADYYRSIGNPTFVEGWLKRLNKFAVNYSAPISIFTILAVATAGYFLYQNFIKH